MREFWEAAGMIAGTIFLGLLGVCAIFAMAAIPYVFLFWLLMEIVGLFK